MTKEVMQQALDVLKSKDTWGSSIREAKEDAIKALEKALKQEQDEPVATLIEHHAFTDGIVRFDGVENMEQLPVGTKP